VAAETVAYSPDDPDRWPNLAVGNVKSALDRSAEHPASSADDEIAVFSGSAGALKSGTGWTINASTKTLNAGGNDLNNLNEVTINNVSSSHWAREIITRRKTADETVTTDTVLSDDDTLVVALLTDGKEYIIDGRVKLQSSSTPDFKYGFNANGFTSWDIGCLCTDAAGGTQIRETHYLDETTNSSGDFVTSTQIHMISFSGTVRVSGGAGSIAFQWAQNTSSANPTTVMAESFMRLMEI
jgi:hypothetical protein